MQRKDWLQTGFGVFGQALFETKPKTVKDRRYRFASVVMMGIDLSSSAVDADYRWLSTRSAYADGGLDFHRTVAST
jgi:hypothetical protein